MVGPRGCRRSEHSIDVKQYAPESGDVVITVVWSDQEGVGGRTTVEKCTWMHQRVEMHCAWSERELDQGRTTVEK
jgi:hypothetical protein